MFRKLGCVLSSIYQTVEQVILFPWGQREPVEWFRSFLLYKTSCLIKGQISLYNSSSSDSDGRLFNHICFEDSLSQEQRVIFNGTFNFFFDTQDIRNIKFYLTVDSLLNDNRNELIDPKELILKLRGSAFSMDDKFCFTALDDELTTENLVFCKITVRSSTDSSSMESYDFNCMDKKVDDSSVLYYFCFGISLLRASWLLYYLQKYCPSMEFTTALTDITPVSTDLAHIPNTDSLQISEYSNLLNTIEKDSKIVSREKFEMLLHKTPQRSLVQDIHLIYSTLVHGMSLNTLYRRAKISSSSSTFSPIYLLIIKDFNETIFGAILSDYPAPANQFYGTGECFVFSFKEDMLNVYPWSQKNDFFIMGTNTIFCVGSDNGNNAIWIDEKILNGRSQPCSTFNNPSLSTHEDFRCHILELWAFTSSL